MGSATADFKNTVFYSTEWTSSCMRLPGTGKRKVKNTVFFYFGLQFSVLRRVSFCSHFPMCLVGRHREAEGADFAVSELFG